jgi:hypothetical protein
VTAPTATFLISQSSNSGIELSANADLKMGIADLANAELGLDIKSQNGGIIKMIGAKEVTPFFQLGRLKRRLFGLGSPSFRKYSMRTPDHLAEDDTGDPKNEQIEAIYFDVLRDEEIARD